MNILYTSYFGVGKGGAEVSLQLLIDVISKSHSVFVASTENFRNAKLLKFRRFRYVPNFYLQSKYLENFLIKNIVKNKIDIIHANDRLTSIAAINAAKKTNKKIIIHFRDYWFCCPKSSCYNPKKGNCEICKEDMLRNCSDRYFWDRYKLDYIRKQWNLLNNVDCKIAISSSINERLVECGIKNSLIIPNGIEIKGIIKKKEDSKIKIAYLGKLDYNKGIDNLLKVIDFDKIEFVIAGNGPLENKVKEYPVKFLGWVKNADEVYSEADIVVVPSLWEEPFGRVAIEAMSFGIPVIASKIGGLKDIVVDGKTGFLVSPNDNNEWKDKINKLISDEKLRNEFGRNGLERAKNYDINVIAKKIEEVYKKCAGL